MMFLLILTDCRKTLIYITPEQPRQGDEVWIGVDNEEREDVDSVYVTFSDREGWGDAVPAYFVANTCKDTGPYLSELDIHAVTTYVDGATGNESRQIDLTQSIATNEDDDLHYVMYVTQDSDETYRETLTDMANAFMEEFDAYSNDQYFWAEPRFYTTGSSTYANSADLSISLGHGLPHLFYTDHGSSDGEVDVSNTSFGSFHPCGGNGDAEYLVFFSCETLSLGDQDGHDWGYFWKNREATKSELRPFSGLHIVMGFRSLTQLRWFFGWDGEDMLEEFAANLDSGDRVVDAWQEAVGDELSFASGYNRGAVIYIPTYEDDTIFSVGDDYIYGNSHYDLYADYWE